MCIFGTWLIMSLDITELWYCAIFLIIKMLLDENFTWTVIGRYTYNFRKNLSFSAVSLVIA